MYKYYPGNAAGVGQAVLDVGDQISGTVAAAGDQISGSVAQAASQMTGATLVSAGIVSATVAASAYLAAKHVSQAVGKAADQISGSVDAAAITITNSVEQAAYAMTAEVAYQTKTLKSAIETGLNELRSDMHKIERRKEIVKLLKQAGQTQTSLLNAARMGVQEEVQRLLVAGGNVNMTGNGGQTALMLAAQGGKEDIAALLLQEGAQANAFDHAGQNALLLAEEGGHAGMVNRLRAAGANLDAMDGSGMSALMFAALMGRTDTAARLLAAGADANTANHFGITPLMAAAARGQVEIAAQLLQAGANIHATDGMGATALMHAAWSGHAAVVSLLLDAGAEVDAADAFGWTPLALSAQNNHADVVALLRAKGANAQPPDGGWAMLRAAVANDSAEVIEELPSLPVAGRALRLALRCGRGKSAAALLQQGAVDANTSVDGWLPLESAAWHADMVPMLLERGADMARALVAAVAQHREPIAKQLMAQEADAANAALLLAAQEGRTDVAGWLLDNGARSDAANSESGETALMLAAAGGHAGVVTLLLNRMADVEAADAKGRTAPMHAIERGQTEAVRACADFLAEKYVATHPYPGAGPEKWFKRYAAMLGFAGANGSAEAVQACVDSFQALSARHTEGAARNALAGLRAAFAAACESAKGNGHAEVARLLAAVA